MTDTTAAKLLPFDKMVDRLRLYADRTRDRSIYPMMLDPDEVRVLLAGIDARPQPAPPAGEPDFHRWLDQKIAEWSAAGGFHDFAVAAKVIRDRLGLAAPPAGESDFVGMAGEISNLLGEARAIPHVKIIEAALCD